MSLVGFLIIGLLAGWIAGNLVKGRGFGLIGNMIVGVLGALLGGFLFKLVGITAYGVCGSLIMSVIGALVLLFLIGWIKTKD